MRILVIAPHPDDETIGAGGALARHIALGDEAFWCIVTQGHGQKKRSLMPASKSIKSKRSMVFRKCFVLGSPL
jgi:LmbE family N-acetylglucosaminyl deacetylase